MNDQPATETKKAPASKAKAKAQAADAPETPATEAPAPAAPAASEPAPAPVAEPAPAPLDLDAKKRRTILIIYALYAASVFTFGITAAVAYVLFIRKQRDDFKGTIWESHITWLDRTFLFSAGGAVAGVVLSFAVGGLLLVLALAYLMYRVVKGFLAYDENKAVAEPNAYY